MRSGWFRNENEQSKYAEIIEKKEEEDKKNHWPKLKVQLKVPEKLLWMCVFIFFLCAPLHNSSFHVRKRVCCWKVKILCTHFSSAHRKKSTQNTEKKRTKLHQEHINKRAERIKKRAKKELCLSCFLCVFRCARKQRNAHRLTVQWDSQMRIILLFSAHLRMIYVISSCCTYLSFFGSAFPLTFTARSRY